MAGALDSEAQAEPGVAGDEQLRQLDHEAIPTEKAREGSRILFCAVLLIRDSAH